MKEDNKHIIPVKIVCLARPGYALIFLGQAWGLISLTVRKLFRIQ
jgi:hypothetical protein